MNHKRTFGQVVKAHRHQLDLTQDELAERASCATITIRRIEADTLRPSIQLAQKLAEVLEIPSDKEEAFIKLARSNLSPNVDEPEEEAMPANESGLTRGRQRTHYLLMLLPLILVLLLIVINPNYLFALFAHQPPFIIAGVLPWGWVVMLVIVGFMWLTQRILRIGYRENGLQQEVKNRNVSGLVLLFLTFPSMIIILVAPAVLQVFRSGVLN